MIYTRFGLPVQAILHADLETGHADILLEDGITRKTMLYELRADGGFSEIIDAIPDGGRVSNAEQPGSCGGAPASF